MINLAPDAGEERLRGRGLRSPETCSRKIGEFVMAQRMRIRVPYTCKTSGAGAMDVYLDMARVLDQSPYRKIDALSLAAQQEGMNCWLHPASATESVENALVNQRHSVEEPPQPGSALNPIIEDGTSDGIIATALA